MGVLVDGVMAAVESGGADVEALLSVIFFWPMRRGHSSAGGRDGGVERVSEGVAGVTRGGADSTRFAGAGAQ